MVSSLRVPVLRTEEYQIDYQPYKDEREQVTFIHCDIHVRWSKGVKSRLMRDFSLLKLLCKQPLFTLSDTDDTKHHKFLRMFGFAYYRTVLLGDGSFKDVFILEN